MALKPKGPHPEDASSCEQWWAYIDGQWVPIGICGLAIALRILPLALFATAIGLLGVIYLFLQQKQRETTAASPPPKTDTTAAAK